MNLAFCLFHYFPFGGLQRDFLRIMQECLQRGHRIEVFTMDWQGPIPDNIKINLIKVKALTNHGRCRQFAKKLKYELAKQPFHRVIGFNKLPGLDIYYAADSCYQERAQNKSFLYRLTPRYQIYSELEKSVFEKKSTTKILLIAAREQKIFQQHYQTQNERFYMLPPGITKECCRPANAGEIRQNLRTEFKLSDQDVLLLMIASSFKTKGLARVLSALQAVSNAAHTNVRLMVIGQDDPKPYVKLAEAMQVSNYVQFLGGRHDVPAFLFAADILVHPALLENTGTVLLESLVAGLPVLTTEVCGYAHYICEAQAGIVVHVPFKQEIFNQKLIQMMDANLRQSLQKNALEYAIKTDLFSLPQRAADIIEN